MAAAQAAGEAVLKTVGDIAQAQREAAMEKAAAAYAKGDQEQFQQALDEAHQWGEGGRYRNALHAAGGALVAGLGGGNALAGAAGAGLSSALAPELDRWAGEVANSLSTGSADLDQALGNAAANLAAGGLGALVGGGSGAASAANTDRFNRQLHPEERQWIKKTEAAYAKRYGLTLEQAHGELTTQANLQVQNGSPGQWNARASDFLGQAHGMLPADGNSGPGYMFFATPEQKANAGMYAAYYPNGVGMNVPVAQNIADSVASNMASRESVEKQTWAAAALASGLLGTVAARAQLAAAASGAINFGADALTAYRAAQASYSLSTGALTTGGVSGSLYTINAAAAAAIAKFQGNDAHVAFKQNFSLPGLATATAVGAANGIFGTSMFRWAGIPNKLSNSLTVPGAVIRINGIAQGQAAGHAAQAMVKRYSKDE